MNYEKKLLISIFWMLLGLVLIGCRVAGLVEEFWSSMGFALLAVGTLQVIRQIRYRTNAEYREKFDTEAQDERNRFIAGKAWAWAGYWFVLIGACATIVLKIAGREELMMMASGSVCLMMLLYWGCWMYLRKKY